MDWFKEEELTPDQEQELFGLWQQAAGEKQHQEFDRDADRILAGINQSIDSPHQAPAAKSRRLQAGRWIFQAAASLLLLAGFLWLFTVYFGAEDPVASRLVTRQTPPGTRQRITLEDGSKITMHAGSRVSYRQPFPVHKREITLEGEAFFEVAKDSRRPFVVTTGQLKTRALGTSFNIRYRPQSREISVALATGAVKIERQAQAGRSPVARLRPGQQLVYDRVGQHYTVGPYDSMEVLAWRTGVLYFKKATLSQVVEKLETWYGVDIELQGQVSGKDSPWHYTGAYDNQRLDDVLEGISFVKGFTYQRKGKKMILKFN